MRGVGEEPKRGAAGGRPHRVGVGKREHRDVGNTGARRGLRTELLGAETQAGEHDEVGMDREQAAQDLGQLPAHAVGDRVRRRSRRGRAGGDRARRLGGPRARRSPRRRVRRAPSRVRRLLRGRSAGSSPRRPTWRRAASVASRSTTSFITSPEWPFTHRNVSSPSRSWNASTSGRQRSWLSTGVRFDVFQPLASHFAYQRSVKHCTTYFESLTTSSGPGSASSASSAARISMRWFVVWGSAPLACAPSGTAHAHPPGPGFPRQAPSV